MSSQPSTAPTATPPTQRTWLVDTVVASGLGLCLLLVFGLDHGDPGSPAPPIGAPVVDLPPPPPPPPPAPLNPDSFLPPIDPALRLRVYFDAAHRFGIGTTLGDPEDVQSKNKRLTYQLDGGTSSTCLKINGQSVIFGSSDGRLLEKPRADEDKKWQWRWLYQGVEVTQVAEIVLGDVTRRMDTVRISYTAKNTNTVPAQVGLRMMIDTLIGDNDGVPFFVTGRNQLIFDTPVRFNGNSIPDIVYALQVRNISNPGVVVKVSGLRPSNGWVPETILLSAWPQDDRNKWDYKVKPIGNDSALGVYFPVERIEPGAEQTATIMYGLGNFNRQSQLSLTALSAPQAGGEFFLAGVVQSPKPDQSMTLELPEGLSLPSSETATKTLSAADAQQGYAQVNWRVQVASSVLGEKTARLALNPGDIQARANLNVQPRNSALVTRLVKGSDGRRGFWVMAYVQAPKPEQTLELRGMAPGVRLATRYAVRQPVPQKADWVYWWLDVDGKVEGEQKLQVVLDPGGISESVNVTFTASLVQ